MQSFVKFLNSSTAVFYFLLSSILTLLIPNYFGPTLYDKEGGGYLDPTTISTTLSCTHGKVCKVLDIPFKVSENKRLAKNLLYGYHGNCLIRWCFANNCQNVYEKQVIFSCFQKPQISRLSFV